MALTCADAYLLVQTVFYVLGCLSGIAAVIPIALAYATFHSHCLLNAEVKWNALPIKITYGESSACTYPIYLFAFGACVCGAVMAVYHGRSLAKIRRDPAQRSAVWVVPFLLVNGVLAVLLFVASCIISVGFRRFCSSVLDGAKEASHFIERCSDIELIPWTEERTGWVIEGGKYVTYLQFAQILSWTCFLVWLVQALLSVVRFCRNIKADRSGGYADTAKIADADPTA